MFTGWVSTSGLSTARIETSPLLQGQATDGGKVTGWVCNYGAAKWCPGLWGHTGSAGSSPNAPPWGILGAALPTTLPTRRWLGIPRGAGCTQGSQHRLPPTRYSRRETLAGSPQGSGTGPLGYFRLVIAGYGFFPPPVFGCNVV